VSAAHFCRSKRSFCSFKSQCSGPGWIRKYLTWNVAATWARSDDFDKRLFAKIPITGAYINVVSKWRVKGICLHTQFYGPMGGLSPLGFVAAQNPNSHQSTINPQKIQMNPEEILATLKECGRRLPSGGRILVCGATTSTVPKPRSHRQTGVPPPISH
jgi:hypothetical protein